MTDTLRLIPAKGKTEHGKPFFHLVRGRRKVGEVHRSLSGAWVGYKWKNPAPLARAQSQRALLSKMERHV